MLKVINVKPGDGITTVIENLWKADARDVILVMPIDSALLQDRISLRILKREAEHSHKNILLVTENKEGRELAEKIGFETKASLPRFIEDQFNKAEVSDLIDAEEPVKKTPAKRGLKKAKIAESPEPEENVLHDMPAGDYELLIKNEVELKEKAERRKIIKAKTLGMGDIVKKEERPSWTEEENEEEPEAATEEEFSEKETTEKPEEDFWNLEPHLKVGPEEKVFSAKEDSSLEEPETEKPDFPVRLMNKNFSPGKAKSFFSREKISWRQPAEPPKEKKWFSFSNPPLKFLNIFIGGVLLVAAAVLYFILPKAEISILPKSETSDFKHVIIADKSITKIDENSFKIPAQLIKLDEKTSQEFPTTGQRQLNEKAHGIITVYNEYSSATQGLVEKTRFVSESGKVFRITKSITIPGAKIVDGKIVASSIDVEVIADQPGEDYNIGPSKFTIPGFQGSPKYDSFYGRSKDSMIGGAQGLAKVVSQDDYDKAKQTLWQGLQLKLGQEMKGQLPSGLKLLDEAEKIEMGQVVSSVEVGSRADNFSLEVKGTATVLLFDENDLRSLQKKELENQKADDRKIGGDSQFTYQDVKADFSRGQLSFNAGSQQKIIWLVDEEQIKQAIAGKTADGVKEIFNQHAEIKNAKVLFWPFWVHKVPANQDKIEIILEE